MMIKGTNRAGFSIMEIMIVLGIIAMMGALIGPKLMSYLGRAKRSTTVTQLASLKNAMMEYNMDWGRYPTKADGGLNALVKMPKGDKFKQRWQPYLDATELPEDGWKNPFIYNAPPVKFKQYKFYEIYSAGEKQDPDAETDLHVGA
jgi:general secretion pathway protein G